MSHKENLKKHKGQIMTKRVWLHRPVAYKPRLVTQAVWLSRPFGYTGRLLKKGRLVTLVVWLQWHPLV